MRSTLIAGLLVFSTTAFAAVPSTNVFLPSVGHGPGSCVGGICTAWRSDVWIFNPSPTQPATVDIFYLQRGAENLNPPKKTITVASGETKELADIVSNLFTLDNAFGAMQFTSNAPVVVTGQIYDANVVTNRGTGTAGQFFAALPAEAAIRAGQTADVIGVAQDSAGVFRTNFGFVETTGNPATVEVQRIDGAGSVLATKTYVVGGREPKQLSVLDIGGPAGTNQRLRFRVVDGTGRIVAFGSRIDNRTGDPSTIQMSVQPLISIFDAPSRIVPLVVPSRRVFLPAVGHAPGACVGDVCTAWRSDVWMFNSSSATANVDVSFLLRDAENPNPDKRSFTIASGETKEFQDVVLALFGMDNVFGALEIDSNVPIIATGQIYDANVVTNRGTGTAGQFFAGLPEEVAIGPDQVIDLIGLAQDEQATLRSNVGILETSGNAATVEVQRLDGTGNVVATTGLGLRARELKQFSILNVGTSKGINQRIRIRVTEGSGRIVAFGSRLDNRTGDPSTVEMATSSQVSGTRIGAILVRLTMPIPPETRATFQENAAVLTANGFTLALDASSIAFPDSIPAGWIVRLGSDESLTDKNGRFQVTFSAGSPSYGLIFHPNRDAPTGDLPLGTFRISQLVPEGANPTPIVLPLIFSTPCNMSPGNPKLAGCQTGTAQGDRITPTDVTYPPNPRADSCEQLDGFIPNQYGLKAIVSYFGSTCNKRVFVGCCPNEGGWGLVGFASICCVKNHKGRFCQEVTPNDLEVLSPQGIGIADLGRQFSVTVHNNGCFGDTKIVRRHPPNLGGTLSGPGLEDGPDTFLLRHYDKAKVDALTCKGTEDPARQVAAWIGDRTLTYELPRCMDVSKTKELDIFNMSAEAAVGLASFKLDRDLLYRFKGGSTAFSITNAARDGWHLANPDVCSGVHVHGNHPCTGAPDPDPHGCGHGIVEKIPQ